MGQSLTIKERKSDSDAAEQKKRFKQSYQYSSKCTVWAAGDIDRHIDPVLVIRSSGFTK